MAIDMTTVLLATAALLGACAPPVAPPPVPAPPMATHPRAAAVPAPTPSADAPARVDVRCAILPVAGGLAGALAGYMLLKDGEMGELIGPLAGAVVGVAIFSCR